MYGGLQAENKMKKNKKNNSLKHRATGENERFLGPFPRVGEDDL